MSKTFSTCSQCNAINRFDFSKALTSEPQCGQCKSKLNFKNGVSDVDLNGLDEIVNAADIPVVVDMWAPWCGPCIGFAPVYQKLAQELGEDFVFLKINTEQYPDAGNILGVRGIPTLIMFKGGNEIKRQAGAMPEGMLRQWLRS